MVNTIETGKRAKRATLQRAAVVFGVAGSLACAGTAQTAPDSGAAPTSPPTVEEPPPMVNVSWPVVFSGRASAIRRLSRDEIVTTATGLIGQAPPREALPEEPRTGYHPLRTSGVQYIGPELGKLYEVVKTFAADNSTALLGQSGCALTGPAQQACLLTWTQGFAPRVLRRALRADEAAQLQSILTSADGTQDGDKTAMNLALTALFFAPSFLYRTEIGVPDPASLSGRILTPDEVAAKLSFFTSLGPADETLSAAALAGQLADGAARVQQFERLRQTPNGKRALSLFIHEWLAANESRIAQKSAAYLNGLTPTVAADMRTGADSFIASVLGSADPTVRNLLTGKGYVSDPVLLPVTKASQDSGVSTGDTRAFARLGLLMHPQILSSHTKENGSSPFQLGHFLKEALMCDPVPAPPAGAAALVKTGEPAGLSMREGLEYRTSSDAGCRGCHSQFAPLGYAFMPFDPVGRWLTQDPSGKAWDLSGSVTTLRGDALGFQSPAELAQVLAASPQVQGCFSQAALEWSLGRGLTGAEAPQIVALDAALSTNGGNVIEILKQIVSAPEFINAAQQVKP